MVGLLRLAIAFVLVACAVGAPAQGGNVGAHLRTVERLDRPIVGSGAIERMEKRKRKKPFVISDPIHPPVAAVVTDPIHPRG
jgi:hypothetical protein